MNRVEISGVLANYPQRKTIRGIEVALAVLNFSQDGQHVSVFALGNAIGSLVPFNVGDALKIVGRIRVHPETGHLAILVEQTERWTLARRKNDALFMGSQRRDLCDVRHADAARGRKLSYR